MLNNRFHLFQTRFPAELLGLICALYTMVQAYDRISNYSPPLTVNQFVYFDQSIVAATSGGVFAINRSNEQARGFAGMEKLPDLNCKAIALVPDQSLFIGTAAGYLYQYHRTTQTFDITSSYAVSGWDIRVLQIYGNYLIVGSSHGISIFDTRTKRAIANAPHIGSFTSASVNAIAIHSDSLYLACDNGLASLDISGNKISRYTYNDPLIWTTHSSTAPLLSFTTVGGILQAHTFIATQLGTATIRVIEARSYGNSNDSIRINTMPSSITTLYAENDTTLWIGTITDYAWYRHGATTTKIRLPGPTVPQINQIYANRGGTDLWMLGQISKTGSEWWEGLCRLNNNQWTQYNGSTPGYRGSGGYFDFRGVLEDKAGNMWFGSPGANIKAYDTLEKTWSIYAPGEVDTPWFRHITASSPEQSVWGMSSALAQDSSGYIWMGIWHGYKGSLICYTPGLEPSPASYRRFLSKYDAPSYYMENVYALNVDARGAIFAGSEAGQLLVFSHNGQPITGGITIEKEWYTSPIGKIFDMTSTSDNLTWIVSTQGLNVYNPAKKSLTHIDKIPATVTAIEAEDDFLFWLSTADKGLIRYDRQSDEITYINSGSGLPSNVVNDISLDRTNRCLWLATDKGVSRFELISGALAHLGNSTTTVYPNPFSRSNARHREIVFDQVPARARLTIFTLTGSPVAVVNPLEVNAHIFTWIPDRTLMVGTYFYQIVSPEQTKVGKILITR